MPPPRQSLHLRSELPAIATRIPEVPLVLVTAPGGSGKSALISAWRDALAAKGLATAWLDLAPLHADLGSFLEELAREIQRAVPAPPGDDGFGAALLRRGPQRDAGDPHRLVRWLGDELRELAEPVVIFLDDYHRLQQEGVVDALLSQALRDGVPGLHLVVATRGARPSVSVRLLAEGRALEVGPDDLSLRADQVERILSDRGVELEDDLLPLLLAQTGGWVTGVLLAARALGERRTDDARRFIAELARHEDLFAYVASELLAGESEDVLRVLENAALLGPAPRRVLEALSGHAAVRLVEDALARGLLLREGGRVGLHQLWEALLRERLRRRLAPAALRAAVERVVVALERAGEPERAVELCAALEQRALGVGLLERHGVDWIERGLHDNVSRWLGAVAPSDTRSDDLAVVRALLDGRRSAARAIDALEAAAERFRLRRAADRELVALHNALILAANENLDSRARRIAMRIVRPRRLLASREARSTALFFMGVAALLSGRYRFAGPLLDRIARSDFSARERGGLTLARGQVAIARGDWERAIALTEESLADPAQRAHGPSYFGLRSMRAFARGVLRRDLPTCLAQLSQCREAFRDFRLPVSEAETGVFMGQLLAREGRREEARGVFEAARRLYEELDADEGAAHVDAQLARTQRELGHCEAARCHGRAALEVLGRTRDLRRRPWSGALAARVLAEEGEVATARAFASRRGRMLDASELPASQHATHLALARIAELAGDAAACRRHLEHALSAAAAADLLAPLPDVDAALLDWSCRAARAHGLDAAIAERLRGSHSAPAVRPPPLRIVTLGTFRVERDGLTLDSRAWRGANPQRLLQRLLVAGGRPVSRALLAVDFWPDAPPAKARASLRAALMRLRQALEPGRSAGDPERWLVVDGEQIAVTDETLAVWDVTHWRELVDAAPRDDGEDGEVALEWRARAIRIYGGPFLPDTLDDWALALQRELEAVFGRIGHEVIAELVEAGRLDDAAALADRMIARDAADEAAWCARVEAEIARGDRRAAARALDQAAEALRRELDAEPGPELEALRARLGA